MKKKDSFLYVCRAEDCILNFNYQVFGERREMTKKNQNRRFFYVNRNGNLQFVEFYV